MIQQLKEKFQETKRRSEQVQVLTVLPKSWSVKKVQQEFGVSEYLARQSKKLVEERGILSLPGPSRGPSLPPETVIDVCSFYDQSWNAWKEGFCISEKGGKTSAYSKATGSE